MTVELAALIFAVVGPLLTAAFAYLQVRRPRRQLADMVNNDIPHLHARLNGIEGRLARLETWMFEHQRNHLADGHAE
jgi:hypothetical protein